MSGAQWRFTDDQGVERAVATEELRASLSSGKVPPSTLVWREGMAEWRPAFTMPELSSAAIAAARRSVPPASGGDAPKRSAPPPLPARKLPKRPVPRTLTGIEPELVGSLRAAGIAVASSATAEPAAISGPREIVPPSSGASPIEEALPDVEPHRGADISKLDDDESWDDSTDVIPKAPALPPDFLKMASPKPLIPTPPPPRADEALPEVPKRNTVMGLGKRAGSKPDLTQQTQLAPTPTAQTRAVTVPQVTRSKPPPPPRRRSEHPPSSTPGSAPRLNRTLELALSKDETKSPRPAPVAPTGKKPPQPPPGRKTDRMGAPVVQAAQAAVAAAEGAAKAPVRSRPPPPPLHRPKSIPPAAEMPPTPTLAIAAVPASYDLASYTEKHAGTEARPAHEATALSAVSSAVKATAAEAAAPEPGTVAAAPQAARISSPDGPTRLSAISSRNLTDIPAEKAQAIPSTVTTAVGLGTEKAIAAAMAAQDAKPTPAAKEGETPLSAMRKTSPVARPEKRAKVDESGTALAGQARKGLSAEKTEVMIREVTSGVDLPPRPKSRTLEMDVGAHSQAAAVDPAPPESKNLRKDGSRKRAASDDENTEPLGKKLGEPANGEASPSSTPATSTERSSSAPPSSTAGDGAEGQEDLATDVDLPRKGKRALEVPLNAVLAVSAAWMIGLVIFFFVGRVSGFKSAGKMPTAKEGIGDIIMQPGVLPPVVATTAAPAPPPEPKPCWVIRQPRKWAPSASKAVPFDMRARDTTIDLGFAVDDHHAAGLRIDPKAGTSESVFTQEAKERIGRVSPLTTTDAFYVGEDGEKSLVPVAAQAPLFVTFDKESIGTTEAADQPAQQLWSLVGEGDIAAEQVLPVGDSFLLTFRRGNDVYAGYFGADRKPKGELTVVSDTSSKQKNGKPRSGTNGAEVAVVYAVETPEGEGDAAKNKWRIAIARGAAMSPPQNPTLLELPPNGPGGDAIAPDVIGLKDGRWLLMWTEGNSGARAIRAQTYDASFQPIGDPIALSPPAGSFGQAMLGVMGSYTTVAFLQAADEGFEMWGAVLQCGT